MHVVSVAADVLADISDPAREGPIEVEKPDLETLRQKIADRALAGSTRADQSNRHGCAHVTWSDWLRAARLPGYCLRR